MKILWREDGSLDKVINHWKFQKNSTAYFKIVGGEKSARF